MAVITEVKELLSEKEIRIRVNSCPTIRNNHSCLRSIRALFVGLPLLFVALGVIRGPTSG